MSPNGFSDDVDHSDIITKVAPVKAEKKLPVMEIFGPTVQGEGLVIGQRTFFVRFGLCDYKCKMCDSMHAVDPHYVNKHAIRMTQSEIFGQMLGLKHAHNCHWVTLSGGNPAIHDLGDLVNSLHDGGMLVSVETQGTFDPDWLHDVDYLTVSPKGPGMGEKFEPNKYIPFIQKFRGHPNLSVKVVVFDARDLEFASMIAEMTPIVVNQDRFYLSLGNPYPPTVDGTTEKDGAFAFDMLKDSMKRYEDLINDVKDYVSLGTVRILPQMHHWLWANERGR